MLESLQAMSLLTIMEIIGPILLFAVLIYGRCSGRADGADRRGSAREAATRELYREGARAEKRKKQARRRRGGGKLRWEGLVVPRMSLDGQGICGLLDPQALAPNIDPYVRYVAYGRL